MNCKESSWNADAQLQLEPTWLQSAAFVATKSINPSFRTNIRNIWSVQTLLKNTLFLPTPAPDFCDCKKSLERNINDYSPSIWKPADWITKTLLMLLSLVRCLLKFRCETFVSSVLSFFSRLLNWIGGNWVEINKPILKSTFVALQMCVKNRIIW